MRPVLLTSSSTPFSQRRSSSKTGSARMVVLERRWSCERVTEREEFVGRMSSKGLRLPQYLMTAMLTAGEHRSRTSKATCGQLHASLRLRHACAVRGPRPALNIKLQNNIRAVQVASMILVDLSGWSNARQGVSSEEIGVEERRGDGKAHWECRPSILSTATPPSHLLPQFSRTFVQTPLPTS